MTQFDCVAKAKEMGLDAIEYEGLEDCIEGIAIGLKNLKRFLAEIEEEK